MRTILSSRAGHPLARFAWGNTASLVPRSASGELESGGSGAEAAHSTLSRLRPWFERHYRAACRPSEEEADAAKSASEDGVTLGDEPADPAAAAAAHSLQRLVPPPPPPPRGVAQRRPQLVVRANGRLLSDAETGSAVPSSSSCSGSAAGDALPSARDASADGIVATAGLDALEAAVTRALRPLTSAWERAVRECRQVLRQRRQQERRGQRKAPRADHGARVRKGKADVAAAAAGAVAGQAAAVAPAYTLQAGDQQSPLIGADEAIACALALSKRRIAAAPLQAPLTWAAVCDEFESPRERVTPFPVSSVRAPCNPLLVRVLPCRSWGMGWGGAAPTASSPPPRAL